MRGTKEWVDGYITSPKEVPPTAIQPALLPTLPTPTTPTTFATGSPPSPATDNPTSMSIQAIAPTPSISPLSIASQLAPAHPFQSPQAIAPLTPLTAAGLASFAPKVPRSLSFSSATSHDSAASTYSRSHYDMLDRLAAQNVSLSTLSSIPRTLLLIPQAHASFYLWSAGNVRLNGLDLTLPSVDAAELARALHADERFEIVNVVYLDGEDGEDWKVKQREIVVDDTDPQVHVRRTTLHTPPPTPIQFDA